MSTASPGRRLPSHFSVPMPAPTAFAPTDGKTHLPSLPGPFRNMPGTPATPRTSLAVEAAIAEHGKKRRKAYKEIHKLGQGSEAVIKLVRENETGKYFAMKVMPKETSDDYFMAQQGQQSARAIRRKFAAIQPLSLQHPTMPTYHELIESKTKYYFVMEACQGDLANYVANHGGTIPEKDAALVVSKLLGLLDFFHTRGIVHRDIKPGNVLLRDPERLDTIALADYANCHVSENLTRARSASPVRTIDSGHGGSPDLSDGSLLEPDAGNTDCLDGSPLGSRSYKTDDVICEDGAQHGVPSSQMKTATGTPFFLPPEIVSGTPYGSKVDLWALGCLAYFLLLGRTPFQDSSSFVELYRRISAGEYSIPNTISPGAATFLRRLLEVDPAKRASASEALTDPWLAGFNFNETLSEASALKHVRQQSGQPVFWQDGELKWMVPIEGSRGNPLSAELDSDSE